MIVNGIKIECHFLFKYKKYENSPPLFVPLCDKDLKSLDIKNIELTSDTKEVKCTLCRRLAPRVLGIKIYPRGANRGWNNRWNNKQAKKKRKQRETGIPNWKRFKSHKKESEIRLNAVK